MSKISNEVVDNMIKYMCLSNDFDSTPKIDLPADISKKLSDNEIELDDYIYTLCNDDFTKIADIRNHDMCLYFDGDLEKVGQDSATEYVLYKNNKALYLCGLDYSWAVYNVDCSDDNPINWTVTGIESGVIGTSYAGSENINLKNIAAFIEAMSKYFGVDVTND